MSLRARSLPASLAAAGHTHSYPAAVDVRHAYAARTLGELTAVVADLPALSPRERPARRRARTTRPEVVAYLAVNLMLITIWAAIGAGYFWPIWPLLGWGVGLMGPCARAWPRPRPLAR